MIYWIYLHRWKLLYWTVVTFFFAVESIIGDYKATGPLLFYGFCWWAWKWVTWKP